MYTLKAQINLWPCEVKLCDLCEAGDEQISHSDKSKLGLTGTKLDRNMSTQSTLCKITTLYKRKKSEGLK